MYGFIIMMYDNSLPTHQLILISNYLFDKDVQSISTYI
jgi:hypothetical protein